MMMLLISVVVASDCLVVDAVVLEETAFINIVINVIIVVIVTITIVTTTITIML